MKKIWNKNYILFLQGQLVSTFGDALYTIAISFFILNLTGSSTLVGTIMGIVTIPRILLGPVAGVVVDRYSKKKLIIFCDLIRGIAIIFISFMAYQGSLKIWMLLLVAIIEGICAAFFNPSMETVMPKLVDEENLVQANSIFNMLASGVDILGQTLGGILYKLLGGPLIFLANGISYILSAGSETFISIPKNNENKENTFSEDIKDGIKYVKNDNGLFLLLFMSFFLNFIFGIIRVLIIPWFNNASGFGEVRYGFFNAACSVGMIAGMLLLSVLNLKDKMKYRIYQISVVMFIILIELAAILNVFWGVMICFAFAFAFQIIFNTLLCTTILLNTDEGMRGKVSATRITICMAASPVGNFIGGLLGDIMSPRNSIICCATIALGVALLFLSRKSMKQYFLK